MSTPVEHLCCLPRNFRSGNKSLWQLVIESGISKQPADLNEHAVREVLVRDPTLLDDWFAYSEDKRSGGWYLVRQGDRCVVAEIGGEPLVFDDAVTACAAFVVRELTPMVQGRS